MKSYVVTIHLRRHGAIGIFWDKDFLVEAEDENGAKEAGRQRAWKDGFELHHITKVTELPTQGA